MNQQLKNHLLLLRPYQWIKNLLVFVPIVFAREFFETPKLLAATQSFVAFSLIASAGYVLNDILDRKQDARHPQKKDRPLAAGKVSARAAWGVLGFLGVLVILMIWTGLSQKFALVIAAYVMLNVLYSVYLKHVVIVDLLLVTTFYLLRVIGGGVATGTFISEWLFLVMGAGALLLIIGKRKAELQHKNQREVLQIYSEELLDQILTVAASLTIITYGLYTVLGAYSDLAIYSTVFVIFGVLRYLYLVDRSAEVIEYPEKVLSQDKPLLFTVAAWSAYMLSVLYK